jgi:ABC-2 type transport system permease protein
MSTAVVAPVVAATHPVVARRTGPSLPALVALEIRKSLSTRSGLAMAGAAVLLAPAATTLASTTSDPVHTAVGPIALMGMLTAYVLFSLGVLSTAGEWSHGSVQTTYLLVPRRSRVLIAKSLAVALIGAVITSVAVAGSAGLLAALEPSTLSWAGAWQAVATVIGAGAAFAVVGAGIGAVLANTPAALTGLYLTVLGVMPVLEATKPAIAHKVDPANAVLDLAQAHSQTQSILVLIGWVVLSVVAGAVMTRRRAVQ